MKLISSLAFSMLIIFAASCGQSNEVGKENNAQKEQIDDNAKAKVDESYSPKVEVLKYEALFDHLSHPSDTLYVVNFWATWCMPCVKELPHFFSTIAAMKDKPVKLILVSLDTKDNIESNVIPFLKKNNYQSTHYLLDDNGRMNEWIPKVDNKWDGAIPATAFYKNGKKVAFASGQLSADELQSKIQSNF